MLNLNSAQPREETPHTVTLSQRAQSLINDRSIDSQTRVVIRYALENGISNCGATIWGRQRTIWIFPDAV